MSKELPLEGYFVCGGGGEGMLMGLDCLGREFTSRTANYDFIIGLPQLDTVQQRVLPPQWTYAPRDEDYESDEDEIFDESERDPDFWGYTGSPLELGLYLGTNADVVAYIFRCRFYTSLTAATDDEFDAASAEFMHELEDWRMHFTSWVGIVTSQDFVGLGGYAGASTSTWSIFTWTSNADGQRARSDARRAATLHRSQMQRSPVELHDFQACVTATGNQGAPPVEWLFIRDACSLLNGGQNRRAVIDAATAAELAMTTLIDKHLATANTDETVRTALMQRYRALDGRAALLRRLRSEVLSAQLQRDLIDPRNRATHGGHSLTDEQAQTAVDMAIEIVEEAYPLADLLRTQ
jgi:hypothetical protein